MDHKRIMRLAALANNMKRTIPASHKDAFDVHQAQGKVDDALEAAVELAKLQAVADYINGRPEDQRDSATLGKLQGPIKMYEKRLEAAAGLEKRLVEIAVNEQIIQAAKAAGAINPDLVVTVFTETGALAHEVDAGGNVSALVDGRPLHQAVKVLAEGPETRHLFDSVKRDTQADDRKAFTGVNPWAKGSLNLTEQGRIYRDNPALAAALKAAAEA